MGVEVLGETAFEDHHAYDHSDIEKIRANLRATGGEIVLTTEKDKGKLLPLLMPSDPWWMLRLGTAVIHGEDRLHRLIDGPPSDGIQRGGTRA
jgi:tetraacyldisaccharide 4'-kinase